MNSLHIKAPALALAIAVFVSACGGKDQGDQAPPAPEVQVFEARQAPLQLTTELPGRISAFRSAEVRARLTGIVLHRRFEEGSIVAAGQLLFEIDPAPAKAALAKAQGQLAQATAQERDAEAVLKRLTPLAAASAISQQQLDTAKTNLASSSAARQAAQADVTSAQIDLGYTRIVAPIAGVIGKSSVTEGALVNANDTNVLTTIHQIDQVYVDYQQPIAQIVATREALAADKLTPAVASPPITVQPEGSSAQLQGQLLFIGSDVDPQTSNVDVRGSVPNPNGVLLPGMYVTVKASLATDPNAITVPQRAITRSADGTLGILVVGKDGKVEHRTVKTGAMLGNQWQIQSGLSAGELVVIGNQGSAQPGTTVKPKKVDPEAADKPAASSAAQSPSLRNEADAPTSIRDQPGVGRVHGSAHVNETGDA